MIKYLLKIPVIILSVILCLLLTNFWLFATERMSGEITIIATVRPQRTIIVNKNLEIQKILSNTTEDVRPIVFLDSEDGESVPYSDSIIRQYQSLKPTLNFSKPGVAYMKESRLIQMPIYSFFRLLQKLFSF